MKAAAQEAYAVVGIFFGLPGILLGPFVGAMIEELSSRPDPIGARRAGNGATIGLVLAVAAKLTLGFDMIGVFLLGALSHQLLKRGSFLKEYFLGDRQLNAWVLSLTYVATSVSAGSFVGFPSYIYRHGWVMALWIGGYMIAGLVSKGVLAKRLNQVSRLSGAITVPEQAL